jgi:antitoxin VapB
MMQTARLLRNGRSQAVRLPKEVRFEGDRVYIRRVGNTAVRLPCRETWQSLFDSLELFSDDFVAQREQPERQERKAAVL